MSKPELFGLVLAGGQSLRMGRDKGLLVYEQLSPLAQRLRTLSLLEACGLKSYVSGRKENESLIGMNAIYDKTELIDENNRGPGVGILSAHLFKPLAAWLVMACDFPFANKGAVQDLIQQREANGRSTAYLHADNTTEPLFTIWEPETLIEFLENYKKGYQGPTRTLEKTNVFLVRPESQKILVNINSPLEAQNYSELQ